MARGKKNANTEGTVIPNDPRAVFDTWYPLIRAAKVDFEEKQAEAKALQAVYRGHLKAYKKHGGDQEALVEAMALAKQEPADVDRKFRHLNETLLWMGVPVGTQLGMFEDGRTIGEHADNEAIEASLTDDVRRHQAKVAGRIAGGASTLVENPHDHSTDLHGAWAQGFAERQAELAGLARDRESVAAE